MILDEVSNRELAALVSVASLAMIGIAFGILFYYWRRFEYHRLRISQSAWKGTSRYGVISLVLPNLGVLVYGLLSMRGVGHLPDIWIPLVIGLWLLLPSVCLTDLAVRTKIKKQTVEFDTCTFFGFIGVCYMATSVFFNVLALNGVVPTMLSITLGPLDAADFELGRWCLIVAILSFSFGIILFGTFFFIDRMEQWKNKIPEENQK